MAPRSSGSILSLLFFAMPFSSSMRAQTVEKNRRIKFKPGAVSATACGG